MVDFVEYDSRDAAAEALAEGIAFRLAEAVAARGKASLVVSGGSSPVGLFWCLAGKRLPWENTVVLPTDERWAPVADARSNEGMIRAELLQDKAARARFVGLYRDGDTPNAALAELNATLAALARPWDAVVLGMGADGHTASLFPNAPDIEQSLASPADVVAPAGGGPPRVSLTLRCLCDARRIDLLFFGDDKRRVYEQACAPGPVAAYPIRGILAHPVVPAAHWAR